jgi:hypothetical protein
VLAVAYVVDGIGCRGEAFFVERGGDETGYATPVAFWLGEYWTCADGRTLSVVLLSTVPALARTYWGHPRCEWIGVLFIRF